MVKVTQNGKLVYKVYIWVLFGIIFGKHSEKEALNELQEIIGVDIRTLVTHIAQKIIENKYLFFKIFYNQMLLI